MTHHWITSKQKQLTHEFNKTESVSKSSNKGYTILFLPNPLEHLEPDPLLGVVHFLLEQYIHTYIEIHT